MTRHVRMEVERVERTITALKTTVQKWQHITDLLRREGYRLRGAWQGEGAVETLTAELTRVIHRCETAGQELSDLVRVLQREKEEWVAAAASFGAVVVTGVGAVVGGAKAPEGLSAWAKRICKGREDEARCLEIWSKPPQNAFELAYMIDSLPEDQPIGIFPLGNGEVLVLLKGTDPDSPERGNNWGSAIESFFTHNSSYQLSVLAALKTARNQGLIPEGAKLHIAGHSQGGMVAQNLASDSRVRRMGLEVETVVTFGSPDTFSKAESGVRYIMFEEDSDIVPRIDEGVEKYVGDKARTSRNLKAKAMWMAAKIVAQRRLNDVERLAEQHIIHTPVSGVYESHKYARLEMKPALESVKFSFGQNSSWGQAGLYRSTIQTPGARLYYMLGKWWKNVSAAHKGGGGGRSGGW